MFSSAIQAIKSLKVTEQQNVRIKNWTKTKRREQWRETVRKIHSGAFVGPKLNERRYDANDFLANRFPVCGKVSGIKWRNEREGGGREREREEEKGTMKKVEASQPVALPHSPSLLYFLLSEGKGSDRAAG